MTRYTDLATLRRHISPDVVIVDDARPAISPAELDAAAVMLEANAGALGVDAPNPLAAKFEHLWQTWGGPELTREFRFHPHRRWRADYALPDVKVLIELEGGIYSGGRHVRADGYRNDVDKYNAATMLGYAVLRLGTGQVDHQHVTEIIDWLRKGVRA